MKKHWITLFLLFLITRMPAQLILDYRLEANIITGHGRNTPFYFLSNRQGLVSPNSNNGYLRAGLFKNDDSGRRFSYSFGVDALIGYGAQEPFYLHQLYLSFRYKYFELFVGSKEESSLLELGNLSSGGMVWSGNARPVPQVSIRIPAYTNIPFTNGWVQVKGQISYGLFIDSRYQRRMHADSEIYNKGVLFHRKNLVLKFEKDAPWFGVLGIDMAAQFGGTVYYPNNTKVVMPAKFKDFLKAFIPMKGGADSPLMDQVNIAGNQLGEYLMEVGYKRNHMRLRAYHEHYFEDHSGMIFKNFPDGLWGISYRDDRKLFVSAVTAEVLSTLNQSGPFLWDKNEYIPVQLSNGDDYYNHLQYGGWKHWGMGIGHPFITSPAYNRNGLFGFYNNRIIAFHLGLEGHFNNCFSYKLFTGYINGRGTPNIPFTEYRNNYSFLAEIKFTPARINRLDFYLAGSVDHGKLLGNNWGFQFKVKYNGNFSVF